MGHEDSEPPGSCGGVEASLGKLALASRWANCFLRFWPRPESNCSPIEIADVARIAALPFPFDPDTCGSGTDRAFTIVIIDEPFDEYGVMRLW
jgi:PIN domain nuclease of toxin-antitoxin system